ncbi:hypothetical protein [Pyxidicoccus xibeiensis]|uniref:hypothetical protein n=1 Tax=Pyxidicoccus xibeiensis TaxID=2906759 RepID=UPI0020A7B90F|nr:hypothetical protein [Pyxidicoccus xibeiensis]MCP3138425.1 hypothetical protein [Pyxidicoccus xibeiensis]
MAEEDDDDRKWHRRFNVRRYATVGARDLVHVHAYRHDGRYDGSSETLLQGWAWRSPEEGTDELFDTLDELLATLEPETLRAAATANPADLAQAFASEHRLGRVVCPGDVGTSVLQDRGLEATLRYPAFDGRTLTFQVIQVPPLSGGDRIWRLASVRASLDGQTPAQELVMKLEPRSK